MGCDAPCLLVVCRVSRHSQPPPCSPAQSSEATTAGAGDATTATAARRLRDRWADGPVPRVLVSPFCPTRDRLWANVHSRRPVAQRNRSHITPHDAPKSFLCLTRFQTGSAKSSRRSREHGARRRGARDGRDRARVHLRGGIARRSCPCGHPPTAKSAMRRLRHEDLLASFVI